MTDWTRILKRLDPNQDGEQPVRHRSAVVDAVNADGTVDLDFDGTVIPGVSVLAGAVIAAGAVVQVAVWRGDMLVLGSARASAFASDFALLGEAVATGSSTDLEVTGIPQTHRDLLVLVHGSNDGSSFRSVVVRFNGDSGNNYRFIQVSSLDNGSPSTGSSQSSTGLTVTNFGDDNYLSSMRMDIPDYSSAINHAVTWQAASSTGSLAGNSRLATGSGQHIASNAITAVRASMGVDDWTINSTLKVYGMGLL